MQPHTGHTLDECLAHAIVTARCSCTPTKLCQRCKLRGYTNSLAGYAERIYPQRVTAQEAKDYELSS